MEEHFNLKYLNNMNKRECLKKIQVNNLDQPIQTVFNLVKFDLGISRFNMRHLGQKLFTENTVY